MGDIDNFREQLNRHYRNNEKVLYKANNVSIALRILLDNNYINDTTLVVFDLDGTIFQSNADSTTRLDRLLPEIENSFIQIYEQLLSVTTNTGIITGRSREKRRITEQSLSNIGLRFDSNKIRFTSGFKDSELNSLLSDIPRITQVIYFDDIMLHNGVCGTILSNVRRHPRIKFIGIKVGDESEFIFDIDEQFNDTNSAELVINGDKIESSLKIHLPAIVPPAIAPPAIEALAIAERLPVREVVKHNPIIDQLNEKVEEITSKCEIIKTSNGRDNEYHTMRLNGYVDVYVRLYTSLDPISKQLVIKIPNHIAAFYNSIRTSGVVIPDECITPPLMQLPVPPVLVNHMIIDELNNKLDAINLKFKEIGTSNGINDAHHISRLSGYINIFIKLYNSLDETSKQFVPKIPNNIAIIYNRDNRPLFIPPELIENDMRLNTKNVFMNKYLKYKMKYLQLKNKNN